MRVIVALSGDEFAPSVVAVTFTVCRVSMVAGAVYRPVGLRVPGLSADFEYRALPALHIPASSTVNCWFCCAYRVKASGVRLPLAPASGLRVKNVEGEL